MSQYGFYTTYNGISGFSGTSGFSGSSGFQAQSNHRSPSNGQEQMKEVETIFSYAGKTITDHIIRAKDFLLSGSVSVEAISSIGITKILIRNSKKEAMVGLISLYCFNVNRLL